MTRSKVASFREELRDRIAKGAFREHGGKLPSVRELSSRHGISKNSVHATLEHLAELGLIESHPRSGYFVSSAGGTKAAEREMEDGTTIEQGSFQPGRQWFPSEFYSTAPLVEALERVSRVQASKGLPTFDDLLKESTKLQRLAAEVFAPDGDGRSASRDVVVTRGARDALSTVFAHLKAVEAKKGVALLEPCPPLIRNIVRAQGFSIATFRRRELEDVGALAQRLGKEEANGAVAFMTNNANPTGWTLTAPERFALATLAERIGGAVVEIDPLRSFSPREERLPSVSALVPERSYFIDGWSKFCGPAAMVGFLYGPRHGFARVRSLRCALGWTPDPFAVRLANLALAEGLLWDHLRDVRLEISRRRTVLDALVADFGDLGSLMGEADRRSPFVSFQFAPDQYRTGDLFRSEGRIIHTPGELFYASPERLTAPDLAWCRLGVASVEGARMRSYFESFRNSVLSQYAGVSSPAVS